MILDCDKYKINLPYIQQLTESKTEEERYEHISMIAVATNVPVIAVCCFIGSLYGYNPKLLALIDKLKKFYLVDEVINS